MTKMEIPPSFKDDANNAHRFIRPNDKSNNQSSGTCDTSESSIQPRVKTGQPQHHCNPHLVGSVDQNNMIPSVNSIGNHSHISSSSSSDSGASIINSSLECNLNEQQQHHHPQGPESKKSIGKNSNSHAIATIVHHNQNHDHDNKSNITSKKEFKRAESSSSSSEVSSLDDWHEKKRKDVVGDLITKMLNEGRVPHFGTCTNSKIYRDTVMADGMKSFKWSPLLSSRNFRVIRGIVMGAIEWMKYQWNQRFQSSQPPFVLSYSRGRMKTSATENEQSLTPPTTPPPSMWFILESFFMFYIVLLVLCDSILRLSSQFTFVTLLGSISKIFVDTEEVTYVILSLLNYLSNDFSRSLINGCLKVTYDTFAMMERKYLWGYHFQGRTILWSDVDRLNKFRKAHLHLMKVTKDRMQNRKDRRKTRMERRKKEKKGIPLDSDYLSKREAEVAAKETLNALAAEIRMKPPTYFPQQIHVNDNADRKGEDDPKLSSWVQSHATIRHLDSLQYCHRMVFRRGRERHQQQQEALKLVSISSRMGAGNISSVTTSGLDNGLKQQCALSPKDAIEIEHAFPDIGAEKSFNRGSYSCGDSTSTLAADSFAARDYDDNSDFDDFDDDSVVSYSSEATSKNRMDWLTVGAKIGQKILNSKEIQRVMNNPNNAKKLLPDEAKKLIDGMNRGEGQPDSPSNASSWEGQGAFKGGSNAEISDLKKSKSIDASVLKRPVHRMWSSPGAAARTPKSEGTPLVVNPSASIDSLEENLEFNGNRKTLVNSTEAVTGKLVAPTEESIELTREATPKYSGGRKTLSTSNEDVTGNIVAPIERSLEPTMQSSSSLSAMKILHSPHRHALHLRAGRVVDEPYSPSIKDISSPPTTRSPYLRVEMTVSSSSITKNSIHRLAPFEKGVKIVVPMFPPNITLNSSSHMSDSCFYQMGTVLSSCRIYIPPNGIKSTPNIISNWAINSGIKQTNCLSIKVILDKALLRGSKFAEMNVRILDEWNYVPRHSKFPIGSCVATTFGIGVLVGWRVEDDFHIIRSLWNKSGPGTGVAYFQRDFIHSVVEAAVGFEVETRMGEGTVVSYVRGGKQNTNGKYFVQLKNNGRYKGRVLEFNRYQILSCRGATFIPVTEHIRAAALYQLEILYYKARVREQMMNCPNKAVRDKGMWRNFSEYVDLFAASFSKAIAEDPDFDQEVDKYISLLINMLDGKKGTKNGEDESSLSGDSGSGDTLDNDATETKQSPSMDSNSTDSSIRWNIHDMLGFFFVEDKKHDDFNSENMRNLQSQTQAFEGVHDSAFVLVRVLLRTVAVARASVPNRPKLHMALAMIHESLLFIRQVLTVQRKNTSKKLIEAWFITLNEIEASFGPLKKRIAALGTQMTRKVRKHGDAAKKRTLKFVDIVLGDTILLHALELGDWRQAISRFEVAIVKAKITDADTCDQLRKGVVMVYKNLAPRKKDRKSKAAAARNGQKMVKFAKFMKVIASPGRSILRVLTYDDVLLVFDRILVRVFEKDPVCSMMINIYAFNFQTIRHLRTLNNMAIAGKLWETVLDAVDEELNFAVSEFPEQAKYFVEPLVKIFSLGVAKFHRIQAGGIAADWLDFLIEDDAVQLIQELDMKFIDSLDAFCKDVKQVLEVLPYIKTIDNDILNLMDEFDFDLLVKELTDSIGDSEKFMAYITERSAVIVERFLDYLPRMSIPIERRELQDGWVLTCRSKEGGDLRLSDISVKRENLVCQVVGSDNVFAGIQVKDKYMTDKYISTSPTNLHSATFDSEFSVASEDEESVLDEVRELILSAQSHGCWEAGVGDLRSPSHFNGVPDILSDLPMPESLKTGIDLWQSSVISDFELLEMAIRDVSFQIQLQKEREEDGIENLGHRTIIPPKEKKAPPPPPKKTFNPHTDPTVLFLDIKNLTLHLDEFTFRVEKAKPITIFDPVFEGSGSLTIKNVSITLKVEIKKERVLKHGLQAPRPVLQLEKLDVRIEKIKLTFKETGADWILNQVLKGFRDQITEIVQDNLKEQIVKQVHIVLEHVNGFIDANPDLLMRILGTTMNDLEETIVFC